MKFRGSELVVLFIVLVAFVIGIDAYPLMPEKVASHWNAAGQVNGYMDRFWGTYFVPVLMALMALLFLAIPRIDPYKKNIEQFRGYYDNFIGLLMLFMIAVYVQTLLWNMGTEISISLTVPLGIAALIWYAGVMCENSKRNWFIGIRTPWTLMSDSVWEQTNRMGGKLFKMCAIIIALSVFLGEAAIWVTVGLLLAATAYMVYYSYVKYNAELKAGGKQKWKEKRSLTGKSRASRKR
ncbi:MAG: SdpI family protein [Candidatus Micrarchaeia archaeon]|jgi:uncharacterized membrane protein